LWITPEKERGFYWGQSVIKNGTLPHHVNIIPSIKNLSPYLSTVFSGSSFASREPFPRHKEREKFSRDFLKVKFF